MSRQSRTLVDIMTYVNEFISKEGARPTPEFVRILADQAVSEIADLAGASRTSWDNTAVTGALTLTGYTCPIPGECLLISSVEYDGSTNPLERVSVDQLDQEELGWRTATGDPSRWAVDGSNIVLNSTPSNAAGKLTARGYGLTAAFSDTPGATNPLDSLIYPAQLAVAKYVVAYYPVIPAQPRTETDIAIMAAQQETKRRMQVRADHMAMWEKERERAVDSMKARMYEEFSY